jgi:hypothetical protein
MVKRAQFGDITTTRPEYVKVFFGILFTHIGLVGCQQCLHLHQLELLLWLNYVLLTLFFRNMALAGHTGKVLKF